MQVLTFKYKLWGTYALGETNLNRYPGCYKMAHCPNVSFTGCLKIEDRFH